MNTLDYSTIAHPLTGENISVHSLNGKTLIRNYLELLTGGGPEELEAAVARVAAAVDALIVVASVEPSVASGLAAAATLVATAVAKVTESKSALQTEITAATAADTSVPANTEDTELIARATQSESMSTADVVTAYEAVANAVATAAATADKDKLKASLTTAINALRDANTAIKKQTSPVWICTKTVEPGAAGAGNGGGNDITETNAEAVAPSPAADGTTVENASAVANADAVSNDTEDTVALEKHLDESWAQSATKAMKATPQGSENMLATCKQINTNLETLVNLFKQMVEPSNP